MAIFNSYVTNYQRVACRIDAAKWHWRSWAFNAFLSSPKLVMRHFGKWSDNTWQMKKRGMGQQFSDQNGGHPKIRRWYRFLVCPKKASKKSWCLFLPMSRSVMAGDSRSVYASIPIHTIFSGMNIHLPAILMFTRGTRFWHTAKWSVSSFILLSAPTADLNTNSHQVVARELQRPRDTRRWQNYSKHTQRAWMFLAHPSSPGNHCIYVCIHYIYIHIYYIYTYIILLYIYIYIYYSLKIYPQAKPLVWQSLTIRPARNVCEEKKVAGGCLVLDQWYDCCTYMRTCGHPGRPSGHWKDSRDTCFLTRNSEGLRLV